MTMTLSAEAPGALARDIAAACDRIAPTWPLDRFIAVNPYWGWRASAAPDAAARLGALAGTALTMPRAWFRAEARAGRLDPRHVDALAGDPALALSARAVLGDPVEPVTPTVRRLALVADVRDGGPGPVPGRSWTELAVHQIGQHCAAWFDEWQASWAPVRDTDLFRAWRADPSVTHGFPWRHGRAWARARLDDLPASPSAAIADMLDDLGVPPSGHEAYLTAVLLSVNGWAAWCAYRRWQARLDGADDDAIVDLLAVRLAWEWLLAADDPDALDGWSATWADVDAHVTARAHDQRVDWVLQAAAERTYQDSIIGGLPDAVAPSAPPEAVAVFCIDVRSEVFRRALETVAPAVQTRGFAGFFGLPIAYTPAGSALTRPQLPGLLAPALAVSDEVDGATAAERAPALAAQQREHAFRTDPSSAFSFVETGGLAYVAKLVQQSLAGHGGPERWEHEGLDAGRAARPRLAMVDDDPAGAAALGRRVLTGMGLLADFPPVVLLCGHGSHTTNNPHAHGLDCGACGGQSGEVNARVLADLLNASAVRRELAALGVRVPDRTWFVPALHDTTTDRVELFDTDVVPTPHRARLDQLVTHLRGAGAQARAERAAGLGLGDLVARPQVLERRVTGRANDWSEVRPEWGLAGNAAFVVAPRWRTRHLDLQGRCFLHDYDWRLDADRSVLTLILTAPMVVTNWINLQYHASTVDNARYGSGNKVLHNVVGGNIGVFEGNGGDLRIGLAVQSLHDGRELRHRPLRLSVFVEAPSDAIDAVIAEHAVVQDLVFNGWLHLLRIDPDTGAVERRRPDGWEPA